MKIAIAAVSSNHYMSGVSRHAANLVKCLLTQSEVSAVHLLAAPWEIQHVCDAISRSDSRLHVHSVPLRPGTLSRNLWYYRNLPALVEQLRVDVTHLSYPSPVHAGAFSCPAVVTLHDLYPFDIPSNFGFPKVLFNRMILKQCLGQADAISCVSDSTRLRLGFEMPRVLPKAVTIHNCVEEPPAAAKPSFVSTWNNAPFLLCVAQHRRNKNVLLAIRVFKRLLSAGRIDSGTRLVVIGMSGPESARIHSFVANAGLARSISFVTGLSDSEMHWCYRNSELLIAPSIVEGFGLPVAEAQLAGSRIVCSDIPAFREVGGTTCTFVELGFGCEERFAEAIIAALRVHRPLPAHLPHLSPAAIGEQYFKLYNLVLASYHRSTAISLSRNPANAGAVPKPQPSLTNEDATTARF